MGTAEVSEQAPGIGDQLQLLFGGMEPKRHEQPRLREDGTFCRVESLPARRVTRT